MSARKSSSRQNYLKPSESRRGFLRVDFDPGSKVSVSVSASPTAPRVYDALDLSVYGLSFLASPKDTESFSIGCELASVAFSLEGRRINVQGRVAYLRKGLIAGLAKVAVEFTEIPITDVWFLSRYVAEKAGVHKPRQIGAGMIHMDEMVFSNPKRKAAARAKKKKKPAKTKAKAKAKPRAKPKARAKTKKKPAKSARKSPRR